MASKAEVIQKLVEPVIEALGLRLWGVEYLGQGRHTLLRIFLDKDGGINIDDCAEASRQISSILDVEDPISEGYTLEVSSPGLDRALFTAEQYKNYVNATVKIRMAGNVEGRRNFSGVLKEVITVRDETTVVLQVGEEEFRLPFRQIEKANLVINEL